MFIILTKYVNRLFAVRLLSSISIKWKAFIYLYISRPHQHLVKESKPSATACQFWRPWAFLLFFSSNLDEIFSKQPNEIGHANLTFLLPLYFPN